MVGLAVEDGGIHGSKIESGKIKKNRDFVLPFCHYSTPKQHG